MENENLFVEWASSQMGYDVDKARIIFSKLGSGCGKDIWKFVAQHSRSASQREKIRASSSFFRLQQHQRDAEDMKSLQQKEESLNTGIQRLNKKADVMICAVSEKESEIQRLQLQYNTLLHKKFLLEQHMSCNKLTEERYKQLRESVDSYYNEMCHRRNRTGFPLLGYLGGSSPLKETSVYQNIARTINYHANEETNKDEEVEIGASNLWKNFSLEDILQSMNFHAKSSMRSLNFSGQESSTDDQNELQIAEKDVLAAKKTLDEDFQAVRDDYITYFLEIQESKQNRIENETKLKEALVDYEDKLQRIYSSDPEAFELCRSIVRLELKNCEQQEIIRVLNLKLESKEKNRIKESRDLIAMHDIILQLEKDVYQGYKNVIDFANSKTEIMDSIMNKQDLFQRLEESSCSGYQNKTSILLFDAKSYKSEEIDLFVKLDLENHLSTEVGGKSVYVHTLSLNHQSKPYLKSIATAMRMQHFHAAEMFLQTLCELLTDINRNAEILEWQTIFRKTVEKSMAKAQSYVADCKGCLEINSKNHQNNLIPFVHKNISRSDLFISALKNIEENIVYCYNRVPDY